MSIIITNVSEDYGLPYGKGKQHYVLGINHLAFVEFTHNFEDGLSECLRAAADAFEELEISGKPKMYEEANLNAIDTLYNLMMENYND